MQTSLYRDNIAMVGNTKNNNNNDDTYRKSHEEWKNETTTTTTTTPADVTLLRNKKRAVETKKRDENNEDGDENDSWGHLDVDKERGSNSKDDDDDDDHHTTNRRPPRFVTHPITTGSSSLTASACSNLTSSLVSTTSSLTSSVASSSTSSAMPILRPSLLRRASTWRLLPTTTNTTNQTVVDDGGGSSNGNHADDVVADEEEEDDQHHHHHHRRSSNDGPDHARPQQHQQQNMVDTTTAPAKSPPPTLRNDPHSHTRTLPSVPEQTSRQPSTTSTSSSKSQRQLRRLSMQEQLQERMQRRKSQQHQYYFASEQQQSPSSSTVALDDHPTFAQDVDEEQQHQYVVRSIARGTDAWKALLEPFVSDLALESVVSKRSKHSRSNRSRTTATTSFRPYHCQAAMLFIDLSGYSKMTAALAYAGAHAISASVNAYLQRLVAVVVHDHGGDVVKFAGDALMVVWASASAADLEANVYCAARAAVALQRQCAVHPVFLPDGAVHEFRIHIGLTAGTLDSHVFCAPKQQSYHRHHHHHAPDTTATTTTGGGATSTMPRLYHVLSGPTIEEIGPLVDLAEAGEICISQNCISFLEGSGVYQDIDENKLHTNFEFCQSHGGTEGLPQLLVDLVVPNDLNAYMDDHIQKRKERAVQMRQSINETYNGTFAEDFIHPCVLDALQHGGGGLSPTQIAQMRELCVLFIAMTSNGDAVNWLVEMQEILDRHRCPIVQIIHDDKGVHIVAAINLYEAAPETPLLGLRVCRELSLKRVGASVGMAIGPSFCGVTGSVDACRWDITGPAVVRAARLMQYALKNDIDFAIDQSVYADPQAMTYLSVVDPAVPIKGSQEPCAVYTISESEQHSASNILESNHAPLHEFHVEDIHRFIESRKRGAVVVTGAPLVGKKIVCQRAAGMSGLVPYLHLCDSSDGFASLARTIATWFQYVDDDVVRELAKQVIDDVDHKRWTCAHGQCVKLVDLVLEKGFQACFVVDRIQFLDDFSLSIIRDCLRTRRKDSQNFNASLSTSSSTLYEKKDSPKGKICFLCVHMPLYSTKTAAEIAVDITRSNSSLYVPVVDVGEASRDDLRSLLSHLCDFEPEERLLSCYAESSGCAAGYFIERVLGVLSVGGDSLLVETNAEFQLQVPRGMVRITKDLTVAQICPQIATRFYQIYDDLPLFGQLILKIVAVANKDYSYPLRQSVVHEVMNRLIEHGIDQEELNELVDEMVDVRVLKLQDVKEGKEMVDREIAVVSPALADIALEVCTPAQVKSIATALIQRVQEGWTDNFQTALVCAGLHEMITGNQEIMYRMWRQAFFTFLCESEGQPKCEIEKWKEAMIDSIVGAGFSVKEVIGEDLTINCKPRISLSSNLSTLKSYAPPLALGPLGCTLSVIFRNVVQELGKFHGHEPQKKDRVDSDLKLACERYMIEVTVLEEYLQEQGQGETSGVLLEAEYEMIPFLSNPASTREDVETKAMLILTQLIPGHIASRRQRLCQLVSQFREETEEMPYVLLHAPPPLRLAYEALQTTKNKTDAAQDALMILAASHWKPPRAPAYLPALHHSHPSIANLRDQTLLQLSESEISSIRHQQSVDDLEAFLLVTALLDQAGGGGGP